MMKMINKFEELIPTITKLTGRKYPEIEKLIQNAIEEANVPLLVEFRNLIEDFEKILAFGDQAQKLRVKDKRNLELLQKYNDLQNIDHLMVIHDSGISIYNYSFAEKHFDPQLISGFLTAILSFQDSSIIRKNSTSQTGFELSYANFIILLNSGDFVKVALILDKKPSNSLRISLAEFISKFENKFKDSLINYKGDIKEFKNANELVEEIFKVSMSWPHRFKSEVNVEDLERNLSGLQSLIVSVASELQKEADYFLLSNIIENIKRHKNYSTDKILGAFFDLKQNGLFLALPMDKMEPIIEKEREKERLRAIETTLEEDEIISPIEGIPKKFLEKINMHLADTSYLFQRLIIRDLVSIPKKDKFKFLKTKNTEWTDLKKKKNLMFHQLQNLKENTEPHEIIDNLAKYREICEELGYEDEATKIANEIKQYMKNIKQNDPIKYQLILDQHKNELNTLIRKAENEIAKENYLYSAFLYKKAIRIATQLGDMDKVNSLSKILSSLDK